MTTENHVAIENNVPMPGKLPSGMNGPQIVWGADAIAQVIQTDVRRTYYLLQKEQIPGAKRMGNRYCMNVDVFFASFMNKD